MASQNNLGRKLVTLYGERGIEQTPLENPYTLERGFSLMNEYIARFAQVVTVHSVSYAPMMFPELNGYRVWLYATVVYSGEVDPVDFFNVEPEEMGYNAGKDQTVLRIYL
jgi:hypothetical protein